MPFLFAWFFAALAFVASAIWAVAVFLVTSLAAVIGPIIGVMWRTSEAVGRAIAPGIAHLTKIVHDTRITVQKMVTDMVETFGDFIGDLAEPVIKPIYDAVTAVANVTQEIQAFVKHSLEPVRDVIGAVEEISGYFIIAKNLEGIRNISDLLNVVARDAGIETAAAIAETTRLIVDTTTSTVDYVQDTFTAFDRKVVHADDRIKEANEIALAELRAQVDEKFIKIRADLDVNVRRFDRDLVRIERRIEDLPWFAGMLLRALR